MTLNDFINKRIMELKMTRSDLVNKFDINWSTLSCITQGKNVNNITKEKLAKALKCSIGDINSILAQQPHPLRKEVSKPGVAKPTYTIVAAKPDEDPEDDIQEPDLLFPREEAGDPEETLAEFRARIKTMVLKEILAVDGSIIVDTIFENIGRQLVRELLSEQK